MTEKSPKELTTKQLTGRSESHLVDLPCGNRLQGDVAEAFSELRGDAARAGFELVIASGFRSFGRQLEIWNGKASGVRPVHDDVGGEVKMADLSPRNRLHAILRFSALPGTSRHHWGTDMDVFDHAAVESTYSVQLTPGEVAPGGVFDPFHRWLDERIAAGESHGFHRPYAEDCGGVAPERWHLSYAPIALSCGGQLTADVIRACWDSCQGGLLLRAELEEDLPGILGRYVAVPDNWCPAGS